MVVVSGRWAQRLPFSLRRSAADREAQADETDIVHIEFVVESLSGGGSGDNGVVPKLAVAIFFG